MSDLTVIRVLKYTFPTMDKVDAHMLNRHVKGAGVDHGGGGVIQEQKCVVLDDEGQLLKDVQVHERPPV